MPRELKPHGTVAAYYRHWRRGESACEPCRSAIAADRREQRKRNRKPRPVVECGTTSGYRLHRKLGEPTCPECRAAMAVYRQQQTANLRARRMAEAARLTRVAYALTGGM